MSIVQTVTGPVRTSELGFTLVHEHLRTWREPVPVQFPHLYDEGRALETTVAKVRAAALLGVRTICDPTVMGLGRNIRFMRSVAETTDVRIVAATGAFTVDVLPPYFACRSIDHMADAFEHDIEVGIQGTDVRAAFLKCATDAPGVTPDVEKVLRAVARVHRRTGVPIMTHSNPRARVGLRQLDVFDDEGVDLSRVLIGHCGDTDDLSYLQDVAVRGAYLGMDKYGFSDTLSTERRNATVVELCRRGLARQMMLSQDSVCARDVLEPDAEPRRVNWNLTYVASAVIPELKALGVTERDVGLMTVSNVRSWFERTDAY
jgi:phosphotriesterase-related protein